MTTRVIDKVMDAADQLREQAVEGERIGKLTDQTVKIMKSAGNIRLLQPKEYGGLAVHPREFAETVMATAADGLDFPANVAFGTGPAAIGTGAGNRTQLYITNMGSRGRHALMVMDVGIAGLPLPMPVDIK